MLVCGFALNAGQVTLVVVLTISTQISEDLSIFSFSADYSGVGDCSRDEVVFMRRNGTME